MRDAPATSKATTSKLIPVAAPLALLAVLAAFPLLGPGPNGIRLLFVTLVWVTTSVAWNLLGGFAGQVSFGFAVFYGLGAYSTAMSLNAGLNVGSRAGCGSASVGADRWSARQVSL